MYALRKNLAMHVHWIILALDWVKDVTYYWKVLTYSLESKTTFNIQF